MVNVVTEVVGNLGLTINKFPEKNTWKELLQRPLLDIGMLDGVVNEILNHIKREGDKAVIAYTKEFDKVELNSLKVSQQEIDDAISLIDEDLKKAIAVARENIEKFHRTQITTTRVIETTPGVRCWQKPVPIEKVGLYIPGGTAPLFSTVLMLGVPAIIAGCNEIVLCTPPNKEGQINPAILYTANLIGIKNIFKIGGVQAIGAMAYGTETVPNVFKIFGPGNQYVTAAKEMVNRQGIAIDMVAGPSEVAVVADETSNPEFIASDLLSQAEHGVDSQVILISTSETLVEKTLEHLKSQLEALPRKAIAAQALKNSKLIVVDGYSEMVKMINYYAPEHLIIVTKNYEELSMQIVNAGSVFLGEYTPESAGDYASGTNHTLPTNGHAKVFSGLNLDSFVKKITFQHINDYGIFNIGPSIEKMAEVEDLIGHKNAVSIRMKNMLDKL